MRRMDALPRLIADRLDEVRALCERHQVRRLEIFGSAAKGTFDETTSDVDLVVEFFPHDDPLVRGQRYLDLMLALQELFDRNVDLVARSAVKNPYFLRILDLTAQPLYDAA